MNISANDLNREVRGFYESSLPESLSIINVNSMAEEWLRDAERASALEYEAIEKLVRRWKTEATAVKRSKLFQQPWDLVVERINRLIAGLAMTVLNQCKTPGKDSRLFVRWETNNDGIDAMCDWDDTPENSFSLRGTTLDCALLDGELSERRAEVVATQLLKDLREGSYELPRLPRHSDSDDSIALWMWQDPESTLDPEDELNEERVSHIAEMAEEWLRDAERASALEFDAVEKLVNRWRSEATAIKRSKLFQQPFDLVVERINRLIAGLMMTLLNECTLPSRERRLIVQWETNNDGIDAMCYWDNSPDHSFSLRAITLDCALLDGELSERRADVVTTQLLKDLREGVYELPRLPRAPDSNANTALWIWHDSDDEVPSSATATVAGELHEATIEEKIPFLRSLHERVQDITNLEIEDESDGLLSILLQSDSAREFESRIVRTDVQQISKQPTENVKAGDVEAGDEVAPDDVAGRGRELIKSLALSLDVPAVFAGWYLARPVLFFHAESSSETERERALHLLRTLCRSIQDFSR